VASRNRSTPKDNNPLDATLPSPDKASLVDSRCPTGRFTVAGMDLIRVRVLAVGDVVRVQDCPGGYRLPDGLPEQSLVTVKAPGVGYADVEDDAGSVWRVPLACIAMPESIWWQGKWIDQLTHPDGAKARQVANAQMAAEQVKRRSWYRNIRTIRR
jgi:hypothetical protein